MKNILDGEYAFRIRGESTHGHLRLSSTSSRQSGLILNHFSEFSKQINDHNKSMFTIKPVRF